MDFLDVPRAPAPLTRTVTVPGSKSITNRAFVLAALADGDTRLDGVLFADDTWQMMNALSGVGYSVRINQSARQVHVLGRNRDLPSPAPGDARTLTCGNSGTTIRFLLAMLATGTAGGSFVLDGVPRMRERPIAELVDQLRALGAQIAYEGREGYPPVRVTAVGLRGGPCTFSDAKSSQYISAVLMAGPYADDGVDVGLVGAVTSEPYVVMTMRMMEQFGVQVAVQDMCGADRSRVVRVPRGTYRRQPSADCERTYTIEPDASNASYFWAMGALVPGSKITVEGLGKGSLQGDVGVVDVLAEMGAGVVYGRDFVTVMAPPAGVKLRGVERDMNGIPDMVQTIAVAALFAQGKTVLKNVWNLRVKETDRLAALEKELVKFGAKVETGRDWISIEPPTAEALAAAGRVDVATYDDHRMAMAFAVAGAARGDVRILDPGCVGKTYPEFFKDLAAVTGAAG
jgi:3-phosphoshikimate 1-carboxyvinyltransferase